MMNATQSSTHGDHNPAIEPVVLCVDDEPSILASLKRALRKKPYKLLTANSGQEALDIFSNQAIDLIVSDMRMPGMSGAELLTRVCQSWPDTLRILLTGYSDMESTVSAINDGRIFRYLHKPWNNEELALTISGALEHKRLKDEHAKLTELTRKQNDELVSFNHELESKVEARTMDLALANQRVGEAYSELNNSYKTTISIFAQLLELREGKTHSHSRIVAKNCENIGKALSLNEGELTELNNAALLHDIGKLQFSDELIATPYSQLTAQQRIDYEKHPIIGQAALFSIPALDATSFIIRAHHERVDGTGFPDGLKSDDIPLAARIISVAADFDDLQQGLLIERALSAAESLAYMKNLADTHYDRTVLGALVSIVDETSLGNQNSVQQCIVHMHELVSGMETAQTVIASNGMLLINEGELLTDTRIHHIQQVLSDTGTSELIAIVRPDNVSQM